MLQAEPRFESDRIDPLDRVLKLVQALGLIGFLGGLASLATMTALGPQPDGPEQWRLAVDLMRAIFYPVVFASILVLVVVGLTLWWRHWRRLNPQRWFRIMMFALLFAIPTMHIWARSRMLLLEPALHEGRLSDVAIYWGQLSTAFVTATAVFLVIVAWGIMKPGAR